MPDKDVILRQLQLEWQDHIQTRRQTWRTLEIEGALIVGLIGVDFKLDNLWVVSVLGFLVIIATLLGILITVHHRRGQVENFNRMYRLEEALDLHKPGFLDDIRPLKEFEWTDVLNLRRMNTPLFIVWMHIAMMIFTLVYVVAKFIA